MTHSVSIATLTSVQMDAETLDPPTGADSDDVDPHTGAEGQENESEDDIEDLKGLPEQDEASLRFSESVSFLRSSSAYQRWSNAWSISHTQRLRLEPRQSSTGLP